MFTLDQALYGMMTLIILIMGAIIISLICLFFSISFWWILLIIPIDYIIMKILITSDKRKTETKKGETDIPPYIMRREDT